MREEIPIVGVAKEDAEDKERPNFSFFLTYIINKWKHYRRVVFY